MMIREGLRKPPGLVDEDWDIDVSEDDDAMDE